MQRTDTIIIGGGQAGLAMSHCLRARGIDHVVLERGRVAERWRSARWDSLRLLTPNWQSRLPGWSYDGNDPDGYMTMPQVIDYLERYSRSFDAPVQAGTTVLSLRRSGSEYRVTTDMGNWRAPNVVIATGYCDRPFLPFLAGQMSSDVFQTSPARYRNPRSLPGGGVLVVGASASGIQLADELCRAGRPVTLAVGRHIRLPRRYRGADIMHWLDAMGSLDERFDEVPNLEASRHQPSLQLVGSPEGRSLDLHTVVQRGVRLIGRAVAADRDRVYFADDLALTTSAADKKLHGLLERIDGYIARTGLNGRAPAAEPLPQIRPAAAPTSLDLRAEGIHTVVWATGYRRNYDWLKVPCLDERGEIRHTGGATEHDGLYALGLQFLRRRKSTFIDGVGDDARDVAGWIAQRLRAVA